MKKEELTNHTCKGPTFTKAELAEMRRRVTEHDELVLLADLFSITGNDTRLQILFLLSEVKEMCVCDIAEALDMNISAISHQLRKLKDKHLILSRRDSKTIFYSLRDSKFTQTLKTLFTYSFKDSIEARYSLLLKN